MSLYENDDGLFNCAALEIFQKNQALPNSSDYYQPKPEPVSNTVGI